MIELPIAMYITTCVCARITLVQRAWLYNMPRTNSTPQEPDVAEVEAEAIASRTRSHAKEVKETTTTGEGCAQTFVAHVGYTTGYVVTARPSNTVIDVQELMAEPTHDILNRLIALKANRVVANFAMYDNMCHYHQSFKK